MNFIKNNTRFYFIGIGGSGQSALAYILLELGYIIYGSDIIKNNRIDRLLKKGAVISIGHDKNNINHNIDYIVVSQSIKENNIELMRANELGITIVHRAELLSRLVNDKYLITITGTHGKTTTTTLISSVLKQANYYPTIFVGGEWDKINGNAEVGGGRLAVVEADESDRSFLYYSPNINVITSIEYEHVEEYKDYNDVLNTYVKLINNISPFGFIIVCKDDVAVNLLEPNTYNKFLITYSANHESDANIIAHDIKYYIDKTDFTVSYKLAISDYTNLGRFSIPKIGKHNVGNALAAICIGLLLGVSRDNIFVGLKECMNIKKRLEIIHSGSLIYKGNSIKNVLVIEDMGHHPTEIDVTIRSLKKVYKKRIVFVFQPCLYSRTKIFVKEFAKVITQTDVAFITDIFSYLDEKDVEFNIIDLSKELQVLGFYNYRINLNAEELKEAVISTIKDDDIILIQGIGGNISALSDYLIENSVKVKNEE
jgi:UDP-N-acetylmuramate--alanine ligase